jgi:hypothetical protein
MRHLVVVLAAVLIVPTAAFADGPIATSAAALVRRSTEAEASPTRTGGRRSASAGQTATPATLGSSGMSRGKKIAIGAAIAVAFAAVVYAIDQGVEDNTPSSRGLR